MEEIWKPIYDFNYEVSNLGRIRNKKTKRIRKNNGSFGLYLMICLRKNRKNYLFPIHRLVAQMFIPNPKNKKEVNHIDGNKHNNNVYNLEWATRKENAIHSIKSGLQTKEQLRKAVRKMKEKNSKAIFQIENGKVIARFESAREASRKLNCSVGGISECANQKPRHKTYRGFEWRYENV